MKKSLGENLLIFGALLVVAVVIVNNQYSGIRKDLKDNWGV